MYELLEKTSEDDYDTDVDLEGKPGETITEEQVYRKACEDVGVSPISYYIRHHHDVHLNLNYRCMSPKAVKALSIALVVNSGNKLKSKDAAYFADTLSVTTNESLEKLNLRWNQIQTEGAVALSAGLRMNVTLKVLDVSYNGFGNEGVLAMGETLKFNNTLLELRLDTNHINNEGVTMLCKGMDINDNVKLLCLSNNPITVDGALRLLEVVRKNDKSNLETIRLKNVLVNETFMELLKNITHDHPQFQIETKGIGGSIVGSQPGRTDPMKVIQDYLDKRKLRLSDFFRNMDKVGNMSVPVSDFRKALQQFNIPLDLVQVEELLSKLDHDNTGAIDYRFTLPQEP
ncbi:hypothetical protein scyTo_0011593 [Scyliorhinus torazame]|uniref:EF-hand domain-containing protein n=1 Tax=Scyliorhinus torazame TaxID=75743 RepID=A0A401NR05_SCYTO|nr:hypothetical protein [Scyliorhinus torazame]